MNPTFYYEYGKSRIIEILTNLIGDVYSGGARWNGGILAPNGLIYFSPYNANQILKLDPATNQTSLVGSIYSGGSKHTAVY
jgi:hypothetical protein